MGTGRLKQVVDLAKGVIPDGFEVRISMGHGYLDIMLLTDDGELIDSWDSGSSLDEQVATAVLRAESVRYSRGE